jgi:hypothetical protein
MFSYNTDAMCASKVEALGEARLNEMASLCYHLGQADITEQSMAEFFLRSTIMSAARLQPALTIKEIQPFIGFRANVQTRPVEDLVARHVAELQSDEWLKWHLR